jgi:hypothetical protein
MSATVSGDIRARLNKVSGVCEKCGGPGMPLRVIAKASKVAMATMYRFLSGKPVTSTNLDKIAAWVEKKEREAGA